MLLDFIMMYKRIFLFFTLIAFGLHSFGQQSKDKDERMKWWREARFGMFIHWGVYAVPAGNYNGHQIKGIGEWIMNFAKIPVKDYKEYAKGFNPVKYDADAWIKLAKDAGMKYVIITAKHHDGFALFDSKVTDWDVVDATPYKKDLIAPLADACRKYGVKLGLYYSQNQDWVHPGGAAYWRAANRGYDKMPNAAKMDEFTKANDGHWDSVQLSKSFNEYVDGIAVPQIKEILTKYGDIAVLWWDTPRGMDAISAKKMDDLLKLQPNIITNNRLMEGAYQGDTKTPEQRIPTLKELDGTDWETCMTMNDTWGYKNFDQNWKYTETLIRNLVDIASKGGNYLLNIGPKADGEIPAESIQRLKEVGDWMKVNGESVYGTHASPFQSLAWGRSTIKDLGKQSVIYFTVFNWPANGELNIPAIKNKVKSIELLGAPKSKLKISQSTIKNLSTQPVNKIASVIKVVVDGKVDANSFAATEEMNVGDMAR